MVAGYILNKDTLFRYVQFRASLKATTSVGMTVFTVFLQGNSV